MNSLLKVASGVGLAASLSACSAMSDPWREARPFLGGLHCGMSEAELRSYAADFRGVELLRPDNEGLLSLRRGDTQILLWLSEGGGLRMSQLTWTFPVTNFASEPKLDHCSGARYVVLRLVDVPAGSEVLLDGRSIGQVSVLSNFEYDVPLGEHEISVRSSEGQALVRELHYQDTSPGHQRLPVEMLQEKQSP